MYDSYSWNLFLITSLLSLHLFQWKKIYENNFFHLFQWKNFYENNFLSFLVFGNIRKILNENYIWLTKNLIKKPMVWAPKLFLFIYKIVNEFSSYLVFKKYQKLVSCFLFCTMKVGFGFQKTLVKQSHWWDPRFRKQKIS